MRSSRLGIFLGGTFAITYSCWWGVVLLARAGRMTAGSPLFVVLFMLGGLGPTLAGYGSVLAAGGRHALAEYNGRVFRWRVGPGWLAAALLIPFGVGFAAAGIRGLMAAGPARLQLVALSRLLPLFLTMVAGGGLEELGWRGVALPELRHRWSPLGASLILAAIWAAWHLPLFFLSGVHQYRASFPVFAAGTLGLTLLLTWLYERTGSVPACVLLHAAANTAAAVGLPWILVFAGDGAAGAIPAILLVATGLALVLSARPASAPRPGCPSS